MIYKGQNACIKFKTNLSYFAIFDVKCDFFLLNWSFYQTFLNAWVFFQLYYY